MKTPNPMSPHPSRRRARRLIPPLALACALTATAHAATFPATEDATVKSASPATNFGDQKNLQVYGKSASERTHLSYLKFPVSGLSGTVKSAKLFIHVTDSSSNGPSLHRATGEWKEMTVTWNTKPALGAQLGDLGAVSSARWYEYDVKSAVTGNGTYTFALAGEVLDGTAIASKETTTRPYLLVTTETAASPSPSASPSPVPTATATPSPTPPTSLSFTPIPCQDLTINGHVYSTSSSSCAKGRVGISASKRVFRFEIRQGDRRSGDATDVDRNELASRSQFVHGTDLWTSFSFMIEPGDPTLENKSNNLGQWHRGAPGSPPLSINMYINNLINVITQNDSGMTIRKEMPIERGKWYHVVFRVRFATNGASNGVLQLWLNGQQQLNLTNAPIGYNDTARNYWKFGIYRKTQPAVQVHYYANMEAGSTDLSHRIQNPLPIE